MNLIFRLIKIVHVITDLFNVSTNTNTLSHIYIHADNAIAVVVAATVVGISAKTNKPYYHDGSMFFSLCDVAFV